MKLYEKLKKIREQQGLTQPQLSELCGIKPQNISRYERGESNLTLDNLNKVLKALDYKINLKENTMKTYKKEIIGKTIILEHNDISILISGETKCIYKGLSKDRPRDFEISKEEFESNLSMDLGGLGYKRKNMLIKITKEYSHDNVDYIVVNTYIPGVMYEENIILQKDYLKDFDEFKIEPITKFR